MAVTGTSLTRGTDVSGAGTSATASISPSANRLILVDVVTVFVSTGSAPDPTLSGAGMTWVRVTSVASTAAGMNQIRFRSLSASPGSGALTITHGAAVNFAGWSIHDHDNVDTTGTNGSGAIVQSATNSDLAGASATITATLGAFGSVNNATCSAFGWFNVTPVKTATPDTGWTELDEQSATFSAGALGGAIETQFIATNDTTAVVTWTGNGGLMALASEIKASGGGGGTRGLFRTPPVNGMGCGGSFFRDPLSAQMQMVRRDRIFVPAWLGEAA